MFTNCINRKALNMVGMKTLQLIKTIPKLDGSNFLEWTRLFNDILQVTWPFLSTNVSELEIPEPIHRDIDEGRKILAI